MSLGPARMWFTIDHSIINEVYYPRADIPQIRDLGFIVADGRGLWNEVKRVADYAVTTPAGIPAVAVVHRHSRFELALRGSPDPGRGRAGGGDGPHRRCPALAPSALLVPHLGGRRPRAVMSDGLTRPALGVSFRKMAAFHLERRSPRRSAFWIEAVCFEGMNDGGPEWKIEGEWPEVTTRPLDRLVRLQQFRPRRSWAWRFGFAIVLLLGAAIAAARAQSGDTEGYSGRHGDGHAEMHNIYKNWHPPLNPGTSCCNNADCRPTRAYVDSEGHWRAWNGAAWLLVPQERVLPADFAGDGRSHLCEKEGFVYCFTPGEIRG